jgi:hypothetical protein
MRQFKVFLIATALGAGVAVAAESNWVKAYTTDEATSYVDVANVTKNSAAHTFWMKRVPGKLEQDGTAYTLVKYTIDCGGNTIAAGYFAKYDSAGKTIDSWPANDSSAKPIIPESNAVTMRNLVC